MRQCDTCNSPHREEIDKLLLAGWRVKEIARFMKGRYPDQSLTSYDSLLNHKRNHVEAFIDRTLESSRLLQKQVREEIKGTIQSAEQLRENLGFVSLSLTELKTDWNENRDPNRYKTLATLITSANKTIELLLKYHEEITKNSISEDELYDRLVYSITPLETEQFDMVKKRWDEFVPR